jgi:hypothetical protein
MIGMDHSPAGRHRLALVAAATAIITALAVVAAVPAAAAPSNDDVGSATAVTALPYGDAAVTVDATTDPDDPSCFGTGPTVWYALTLSEATPIVADTFGSDYDTTLSVYTGSPGALTQIACNDDHFNSQSRVAFNAAARETYYLLVGAAGGGPGGNLDLRIDRPLTIDLGDSVQARVTRTGEVTLSGTVSCSQPTFVRLFGTVEQRSHGTTVTGHGYGYVDCDRMGRWTMGIAADRGSLRHGPATFRVIANADDAFVLVVDEAAGRVVLKGGGR